MFFQMYIIAFDVEFGIIDNKSVVHAFRHDKQLLELLGFGHKRHFDRQAPDRFSKAFYIDT